VFNLDDVKSGGGDAVHINFWSGLGAYTSSNDKGLITHYQRSGIRILTDPDNKFSISWPVLVKLGIMAGIDTMHVGMLGGYYPEGESEEETLEAVSMCVENDRVAALSCGMNPDTAREIRGNIGDDWMANIGGWLHTGESIYEKVYEMRKSLD
jgi:ribulose 1,5-bisphosphate carboxylase large subunit-like protein